MEILFLSLALCEGNPPMTGEFPRKGPAMWSLGDPIAVTPNRCRPSSRLASDLGPFKVLVESLECCISVASIQTRITIDPLCYPRTKFTVEPLKFGNGQIISPYILLDLRLLIQAGINVTYLVIGFRPLFIIFDTVGSSAHRTPKVFQSLFVHAQKLK